MPPRPQRSFLSSLSVPQVVAFAGIGIGLATRHVVGYVIAGVAFSGVLAAIVIGILRSDRAFERVRKRIAGAAHWPKQEPTSEGAIDPYESDRVMGAVAGRRVRAALHATGAIVCVELPRWPSDLALVRRGDTRGAPVTGDDAFDRVIEVRDPLDGWRSTLTSRLRAQLCDLFGSWRAVIENQTVTVELGDDEVEEMESVLDLCINLEAPADAAAATEREAVVFALAKEEPLGSVRLGHYRWLVERDWNAPLVYRAAAADADADISSWAREHLPPDAGAFR